MADRISTYRVARLSLHIPVNSAARAHYALLATGVKNGVPRSVVLADGTVPCAALNPTTEEILEAMHAALAQHMLG